MRSKISCGKKMQAKKKSRDSAWKEEDRGNKEGKGGREKKCKDILKRCYAR